MLLPRQQAKLARGAKDKEHAMSQTPNTAIAVPHAFLVYQAIVTPADMR